MTATTTLLNWTEVTNQYADCKAKTMLVALHAGAAFNVVKTNGGRYRLLVEGERNGSDVGGAGALDAIKERAEGVAAALTSPATPVPVVADDADLEAQAVEAELVASEPHLGDLEEVPFDTTDEDDGVYTADEVAHMEAADDDTPLTPDEEEAVAAELERIAQRRKEAEEDAAQWDAALNRREQPKGDVVVPVVAATPTPQPKAKRVKAAKPAAPKGEDDGFGPDGWGRTKGGAPAQHKSGRAQVNAETDANGKRLAARGRGWWLAWVDGTQLPGKFKNMNEAKAAVAAALGHAEG